MDSRRCLFCSGRCSAWAWFRHLFGGVGGRAPLRQGEQPYPCCDGMGIGIRGRARQLALDLNGPSRRFRARRAQAPVRVAESEGASQDRPSLDGSGETTSERACALPEGGVRFESSWPCGQNSGRRPEGHRKCVTHGRGEGPRRTGFDCGASSLLYRALTPRVARSPLARAQADFARMVTSTVARRWPATARAASAANSASDNASRMRRPAFQSTRSDRGFESSGCSCRPNGPSPQTVLADGSTKVAERCFLGV